MSSATMSLKAKIRNYAKQNHITAQVVLQNYMFERFLERLSISQYKDRFIIKGGILVTSLVGLNTRSTMDLDTTIRNMNLSEDEIKLAITSICQIKIQDDVTFEIKSIKPIRKDSVYGGYCVRLDALFDSIITPLSIDVTTGDVITPSPIKYEISGIFDSEVKIDVWGYNIETILAEKMEAILTRGVLATRPKDYYDIYVLGTTQHYLADIFKEAYLATAKQRGTLNKMNLEDIYKMIQESDFLKNNWKKYQETFSYASDISYDEIMLILHKLIEQLK